MASEVSRKSYGMTDKGQVVVIEKSSFDAAGVHLVSTFEVRHGVRTIGDYTTARAAGAVASAVAGFLPPEVKDSKAG